MAEKPQAFAVWLTGLPASGKSSIAQALQARLSVDGIVMEVLESDEARRLLTPVPTYQPAERELFYRALVFCGSRLVAQGVPVIFDATANRRAFREFARTLITRFLEVAVVCPLEVCRQRDRKGTYVRGVEGQTATVPGLQEPYEPPLQPDVVVDTTVLAPEAAAGAIVDVLYARGYVTTVRR